MRFMRFMRFMRLARCVLVLVCGAMLAACGQASPSSVTTVARSEACPSQQPVHLPNDLGQVDRAYLCSTDFRRVVGDGEWSYDVVQGVTAGLNALLKAYGAADDAPPTSGGCTADLPDPLVVYLQGERSVAVRAPHDPCGKPTAAARAAYEALELQELTATKNEQVASQQSFDTQCSDTWKDMLAVEEESGSTPPPTSVPNALAQPVRLCVYEIKADAQGARIGRLSAGSQLTGEQLQQVNAALAKSVVDPSCGRHDHTSFALLWAGGGGSSTLIAIDGCAVQQDDGWWRATDRLRELVHG